MARRRREDRDLFGYHRTSIYPHGEEADRIALDLRRLSEAAHRIRLNQSAFLIEVAANIVQIEGVAVQEAEGQS
jgi:ribosomal protein L25 (general stress protein Ctc)